MRAGDSLALRCSAKINLYLAVTGARSDGYHDIETFFQPVSIYDSLRLTLSGAGISLSGDDPGIPWDSTNLCHRAAVELFGAAGYGGGVSIEVRKEIPHGAGLGGGSSDAAAVLFGLDALIGAGLGSDRLMELGLRIGSDVPFFLSGGPAIGRGRGERLEGRDGLRGGRILIVKPPFSVSTAWAYDNVKIVLTKGCGVDRLNCLMEGLKDLPDIGSETFNSFESVVVEKYPEIGCVLESLRSAGSSLCSLSGSGAACFALFGTERKAIEAERLFREKGFFTRIARPVDRMLEYIQW